MTRFEAITSPADLRHLAMIRDQAEVTIFGAETFRTYPKEHRGTRRDHSLTHIIMSRSVQLDWTAALFQSQAPVTIASPLGRADWKAGAPPQLNHLQLPARGPSAVVTILKYCREMGFENVLIEGGGTILEQFLAAGVVNELYLTLAPRIIGNPDAPALIPGVTEQFQDVQLELMGTRSESGDVFLHYRVR